MSSFVERALPRRNPESRVVEPGDRVSWRLADRRVERREEAKRRAEERKEDRP